MNIFEKGIIMITTTLISSSLFSQTIIQTITSSSTLTIPNNVSTIIVEVIGGGGSGGGNGTGGGGGGGYAKGTYAVLPNSSYSVTIGGASGTTSFGSIIQATGGGLGVYVNNPNIGGGGAGGVGSGGVFNYIGGTGGGGYYTYFGGGGGGAAGSNGNGSNGGNTIPWTGICLTPGGTGGLSGGSPAGAGGKGAGFSDASCNVTNPAGAGVNYGGGGGGGNGNGGQPGIGSPGVCIVTLIDAMAPPLGATGSQTNVLCFGNATGSATVIPIGGTSPYAYAWTGGGTAATKPNLIPGIYTVTVTDALSTTTTLSFTITGPPASLILAGTQDSVTCYGENNGGINVIASGGTSPYQYSLDGTNFATSSSFTGLIAGNYVVYVKDANNCLTSIPVSINEPSILMLSGVGTTITTTNNGTITLAGNGGVAPYQYSIDGVNFATNAFFNNLIGGIYSCEIMDGNGCVGVTSVVLDDVTGMSENQSKKGFEVSVFPNPSEDWITIESTTNLEENYQLLDAQGRILLKGKTNGSTTTVSLKAIKSGNYILKIGAINASIRIRKN